MTAASVVDQALFETVKAVHRSFPTGVTIVTTSVDGAPYGLAVNAFSSVSMGPPMVLVCINETSSSYPRFFEGTRFGVSILANDQASVAGRFAKSGGDKFGDVAWHPGPSGSPLISGASANLDLEVVAKIPAATHMIFIGRVIDAEVSGKPPLIYHGSQFFDGAVLDAPLPKAQGGAA